MNRIYRYLHDKHQHILCSDPWFASFLVLADMDSFCVNARSKRQTVFFCLLPLSRLLPLTASCNYCGWRNSCTTLDGWNPMNNGMNHLSIIINWCRISQPSTVCFHNCFYDFRALPKPSLQSPSFSLATQLRMIPQLFRHWLLRGEI